MNEIGWRIAVNVVGVVLGIFILLNERHRMASNINAIYWGIGITCLAASSILLGMNLAQAGLR